MKKSTLFIITHKAFSIDYLDNYVPIQVGKNNTKLELGYISDDTGINIAEKNKNYCELTGIYWALHNYELTDFIGLVHYRRFFRNSLFNRGLLDEAHILKIMKKYDVILPYKFYFKDKIWDNYFKNGAGKEHDLIRLKNIIYSGYEEYIPFFDSVMNDYSGFYCNMFVMKKKDFIAYHNWLFEVLNKLETVTDLSGYTSNEARIYGYISEILLNVWIRSNKLKIKSCPVWKTDNSFKAKVFFKYRMLKGFILGNLKKFLSFFR